MHAPAQDLAPPPGERPPDIHVDLPNVPDFAIPATPDGTPSAIARHAPPPLPPALPPPPSVVMRAPVATAAHAESLTHLEAANRAFAARRLVEATAGYKDAVTAWGGNHVAWYGLGGAAAMAGDWTAAADAFRFAAELRPDSTMYEMWLGVALYELAAATARVEQARKQGANPDDVRPDLSAVDFDPALAHLLQAVQLGGDGTTPTRRSSSRRPAS